MDAINALIPNAAISHSADYLRDCGRTQRRLKVYRRKIKFYTLGCKVNQYETQQIREQFLKDGFREAENNKNADICVINTCTVTHKADADSLNFIRRARKENPKARIVVTGCLAELDAEKIRKIGGIDFIIRNRSKDKIPEILFRHGPGHIRGRIRQNKKGISFFQKHTRAFLKIQDGCDNSCSYCKVPLVRGRSKSRPLKQVISEAQNLVKNGFKEIVLCGICLGSYGKDLNPGISLVDAVLALETIEGLLRIRLSSIEAGDISDALINTMSASHKLCRHLHIPIQSGDDAVLGSMNRKYRRDDYLGLIKKIKRSVPGVAITTDCIVGFPGETEENFRNTLDLVLRIAPLRVHAFPYSRRQGTAAGLRFSQELSPAVVRERLRRLRFLSEKCAVAYIKKFIHKKIEVLIEDRCKNNNSLRNDHLSVRLKKSSCIWQGHAGNYINVRVHSRKNIKNKLLSVKITGNNGVYLVAKLP